MTDIASPILQWLNANPQLAGLATFLISTGESVAIIGTIVPGSVMMTAIGALIGAGIIPFWSTLIWAILGAIAGDGISYWIGYHFKNRLNYIWPFKTHPQLLASGKLFFNSHGGKSVFIGRFVGPVRALVPLVAGMLGVKPLRFTIANITSAIGWAPIYMLPGILLGAASVEIPSEVATRVILMLILTGLFIILCLWLLKKIFELIKKEVDAFETWLWNTLKKSRYFHYLTAALKHYDKTKTHGQLTLGFYLLVIGITLIYILSIVMYQGPQNIAINNVIFHLFRSLRTPSADHVMLYISFLGEKYVLLSLSLLLFAWLAWTKRMHTAWHALGLGIVAASGIEVAKHFVHSPRPWGIVNGDYGSQFSFPSGHTTLAVMYYFSIALLLIKTYKIEFFKKALYLFTGAIVIAICVSRLYFGAHWFTDIVGSLLLGTALLLLIILSYNRKVEKKPLGKGIFFTTLLSLCLAYSVVVHFTFDKFKTAYTMLAWPTYHVTFNDWWLQQGNHFPLQRVNRFGLPAKVFNVQWIGDLNNIQTLLLKNGWEIAPKRDWLRVIYRITAVNSTDHLPLVSPTYLDNAPVLILIKHIKGRNKLMVLRFWDSYAAITHAKKPLWMGSLEYAPSTYSWLFKHRHPNELIPTTTVLFNKVPHHYTAKNTTVTSKVNGHFVTQTILLIKPE